MNATTEANGAARAIPFGQQGCCRFLAVPLTWSLRGLRLGWCLSVQIARPQQLERDLVRCVSQSEADSRFEMAEPGVAINHAINLMKLLVGGIKLAQFPVIRIMLNSN